MTDAHDTTIFHAALILLGAVALVIPLFHRMRISPVVGYILIGLMIGPSGLGRWAGGVPWLEAIVITDARAIAPMAELGVVLLMFMIGLETSFRRLWVMRRLVFGLGIVQVVMSAAVIAGFGVWIGVPLSGAVVLGLALAMSSTAVVLQVLADERRLSSPAGRAAFAVLLFQDITVVPVLFMIGLIGSGDGGLLTLGLALGQAALVVVAIYGLGQLALRPLFRIVARTGSPDLFMAACLLVVIGTGTATAAAGMSMALGGLIGGLLLAETEYRRQVELMIGPFKGLLVGLFLISIGMGLDLRLLADSPVSVLGGAALLLLAKLAIVILTARAAGATWGVGLRAGLLLAPGGEFGFVILGAATTLSLVPLGLAGQSLMITAITMACIPGLSRLGEALARRPAVEVPPELLPTEVSATGIILAGFGRVGETVGRVLEAHGVRYVAMDGDIDRVVRMRAAGKPVYWGDITRPEMLGLLHLEEARALVVTMGDAQAADAVVTAALSARPDLQIVARARDARHAARLYSRGVTDAVPETLEASLQLSEAVLVDIGIPMGPALVTIHEERAAMQAELKAMAPAAQVRVLGYRRLRDIRS
jgi:CPA2 family monovalent cation:H+ antiporter-2